MMLFAVQSLKMSQIMIIICRRLRVPVCNVSLMHELEALIRRLSELTGEDKHSRELTSQTCVKNATNSPNVWK